MSGCRAVTLAVLAGILLHAGFVRVAQADPPTPAANREAGKHFSRGVTLYNEADYHAALVEFKRAYDIAPSATVLYNIGQTYYQLQNYAAALSTLDRYLAEAGPTAPHRSEVEATIDTLQSRVGKLSIITTVADCEIAVDDEVVGKTPIREPIPVSVGRRKLTASRDGRVVETRFVDVAAGDTVQVPLSLTETNFQGTTPEIKGPSTGERLVTAGKVSTVVLGVGALVATGLAYAASRDLKNTRGMFPVTAQDLDDKSKKVSLYATTADILALATLAVGGVTLVVSLSRSDTHEVHVAVSPTGVQLAGTFR